jgi:hypothetical protein
MQADASREGTIPPPSKHCTSASAAY